MNRKLDKSDLFFSSNMNRKLDKSDLSLTRTDTDEGQEYNMTPTW